MTLTAGHALQTEVRFRCACWIRQHAKALTLSGLQQRQRMLRQTPVLHSAVTASRSSTSARHLRNGRTPGTAPQCTPPRRTPAEVSRLCTHPAVTPSEPLACCGADRSIAALRPAQELGGDTAAAVATEAAVPCAAAARSTVPRVAADVCATRSPTLVAASASLGPCNAACEIEPNTGGRIASSIANEGELCRDPRGLQAASVTGGASAWHCCV